MKIKDILISSMFVLFIAMGSIAATTVTSVFNPHTKKPDYVAQVESTMTGAMDFKGEYAALLNYSTADVVTYEGSSFVARQPSTGETPGETAYWQTLASGGTDGEAGAAGPNSVSATTTTSLDGYIFGNNTTCSAATNSTSLAKISESAGSPTWNGGAWPGAYTGNQTANYVLAAPNGEAGEAAFRALVAADIPTLNQNTTGTAANVSGTPALPNGTTATTQAKSDSSTKLATTAFVMTQTNSATAAGIVASGAAQNAKVWKTDADGVPDWRDDATGGTPTFDTVGTGTSAGKTLTVGSGSTITYESTGVVNANQFAGVTTVDATEFGYLNGVSSALQTQLNAKAPSASPTLVTPTLGVASATSINKVAITAPATGSTLTVADGKTLTASNTLTLAGTDGTTITFPGTSATIARTDAANTFTGHQTIEGVTSTGATGTGKFVFDTSPTLASPTFTSPALGAATATSINKVNITAPASGSTLTVADGKVATISNTLTFSGTDGSTLAVGTGGTLGTAAYTAATAYQAADSDLTTWAGVTPSANGQSFVAAANYAAMRTLLGLGTVYQFNVGTGANNIPQLAASPGTPDGTKFLRDDGTWVLPTGSGDVTSVGNCTSGACNDETSDGGSYIGLYHASGAVRIKNNAGVVETRTAGDAAYADLRTSDITADSVTVAKVSGTAGDVGLYEANSTDTDAAGFKGPASLTANNSYRLQFSNSLPANVNYVMGVSNATPSGTGTPTDPYVYSTAWVDLDNYLLLAGGTLTGKLNIPTTGTTAGFNIYQSASDPSSPVNGDVWMTASGLKWRTAGTTYTAASGAPAFSDVTAGESTVALTIGTSGSLSTTGTGYISAGGIVLGDASPDANGEIGYATNAYTLFANSEDLSVTAGTNMWTFNSSTGGAFTFTPAVTVTGALTASTSVATPFVALGTDPADAGSIRLPNAGYIYSEADAAGTDISVIGVDSSEVVQIGASGASGVTITPNVTVTGDITVTGSDVSVGVAGVKLTGDGDGAITFLGMGDGSDENLTINLDDTANEATVSSSTGVNLVRLTQGIAMGANIPVVSKSGSATLTVAEMNSSVYATAAATLTLPEVVASSPSATQVTPGAMVCVYSTGANVVRINPNDADGVVLNGATRATNGVDIYSAGAAGNFMCIQADSASGWTTWGASGVWTAGS